MNGFSLKNNVSLKMNGAALTMTVNSLKLKAITLAKNGVFFENNCYFYN